MLVFIFNLEYCPVLVSFTFTFAWFCLKICLLNLTTSKTYYDFVKIHRIIYWIKVRFVYLLEAIDYTGATATVIGWGRTGESEPVSNELRRVNLPILSQEECDQAGYQKNRISENMFCAGYLTGNRDACFVSILLDKNRTAYNNIRNNIL